MATLANFILYSVLSDPKFLYERGATGVSGVSPARYEQLEERWHIYFGPGRACA